MEPDRHRHRLGAEILDAEPDLERATFQPVGHLEHVRERKLRHPGGLPVELESARHPRRRVVGLGVDDLPVRGEGEEPVNRPRPAHVPEIHVEGVTFPVGVERLLVEPIGPRTEERNAAQPGRGSKLLRPTRTGSAGRWCPSPSLRMPGCRSRWRPRRWSGSLHPRARRRRLICGRRRAGRWPEGLRRVERSRRVPPGVVSSKSGSGVALASGSATGAAVAWPFTEWRQCL